MGNHSDLWMRGMTEIDLELTVIDDNGKPRIVESAAAPKGEGRVIKKKGQILTVTAREALDGGLSTATVTSLAEIRAALNLPAWHDTGDAPASILVNRQLALKERARETDALREKTRQQLDHLRKSAPAIAAADKAFDRAMQRVTAIDGEIAQLKTQADADAAAINAEYQATIAKKGDIVTSVRAKDAARAKLAQVQAKYSSELARLRTDRAAALEDARKTLDKSRQTLTSAPPLD
jgi:chromosome segregation ATPase